MKFCGEFLGLQSSQPGETEMYTMVESLLPLINPWNPELSQKLTDHIQERAGARVVFPSEEKFNDQPPYQPFRSIPLFP